MIHRPRRSKPRDGAPSRRSRGQALVEFSLVLPLFMFMLLAIIEFAFVFSAILGVSYASRDAALVGAEAGTDDSADCAILKRVDDAVSSPASDTRITRVVVYRTNLHGNLGAYPGQSDTFVRGGNIHCTFPDGSTYDAPYTRTTSGYLPATRCNVLAGCPAGTRELDIIGVQITYVHSWVTPLRGLGGPGGASTTITQSNAMRMEPQS